eukprot:12216239-Ditylum_brightwellii.AAC.2
MASIECNLTQCTPNARGKKCSPKTTSNSAIMNSSAAAPSASTPNQNLNRTPLIPAKESSPKKTG